ncbi:MAG: (Fe-S)-binding protein, partial [Eubacteriales bacterium]|nr:(Fe-S)-binding protein [Eubacteriales bacterium]
QVDVADSCPEMPETGRARLFPTAGGILKTMERVDDANYSYLAVDGLENCIAAIREVAAGGLNHVFIEMSACTGSCIGGPVMDRNHLSPIKNYSQVTAIAGPEDLKVEMPEANKLVQTFARIELDNRQPDEIEIQAILRQIGKTKPEHELNCGTCGYDTCRQKAIAVYQGKADLSMCLPYLKEKAESFSDNIISNTPNGIIVVNDSFQVQQINRAALNIMNIRCAEDVLGEQVVRIMDPKPFMDVLNTGRSIHGRRTYLAEYKKYVEKSIILDREFNLLICIMHDVTDEEKQRERKESIRHQTIDIADKVVEKQMRIVQEIASLLGETAAETKIALTKLKESISDE